MATSTRVDSALLSFVAAFVDTCSFVGLYGLFAAHVTGNFVLMGAELVQHEGNLLPKLLSFPVFILAVAFAALLAARLKEHGRDRVRPAMALQCVLLCAAAGAPLLLGTPAAPGSASVLVPSVALVLAMGLQNGLMRLELAALPPTTVMTGNVTQVTVDMVNLALRPAHSPATAPGAPEVARLRNMWPGVLGFLVGAGAGAVGFASFGLYCLALPAGICAVLACRLGRTISPSV
ncbi:MAG: hypothetical protein JWQ76_5670 [Ramlibacter sp.]|nr:hypothetical protein [Ramlibacter sp.]